MKILVDANLQVNVFDALFPPIPINPKLIARRLKCYDNINNSRLRIVLPSSR